MDQILLGLGAAGAALLVIAVAVALWEHRRHMGEMRQQLAWSENTRDLLQAHAKDVDGKLATQSAAVNSQLVAAPAPAAAAPLVKAALRAAAPAQVPAAGLRGTPTSSPASSFTSAPAQRLTSHAGTARVAMAAAAQSALTQQWIDTEPMVLTSQVLEGPAPDFDPTMPAELSEH